MQEMDRRVGLLRLMLADITDRERQGQVGLVTLQAQLKRIVEFTVQFNGGVGNALASMAEVEERIARQGAELRHLALLRRRAEGEIQALLVTRGIADARARLAELEQRRAALVEQRQTTGDADGTEQEDDELAAIVAEIAALQAEIHSASQAAARALTESQAPPRPNE
jgi:chromosome segregation ATPase